MRPIRAFHVNPTVFNMDARWPLQKHGTNPDDGRRIAPHVQFSRPIRFNVCSESAYRPFIPVHRVEHGLAVLDRMPHAPPVLGDGEHSINGDVMQIMAGWVWVTVRLILGDEFAETLHVGLRDDDHHKSFCDRYEHLK